MQLNIILCHISGTENAVQQQQQQQTMQTQPPQQMVAGQQPQQLQQHPASAQFRHPLPPASIRPGLRLGLPGSPVQVITSTILKTNLE